jgi:histidinol-phosphate/aromatic aminotransferase/cobyric acid decarboxylase-like protein
VGYGIARQDIINVLLCAKIPWNVNCVAQAAAVAALKDGQHLQVTRELIKKEKEWLLSELTEFKSFKIHPSDANFYFIDVRKSGHTAAELRNRILAQGILIRDCTSFKGLDEFYIRIAVKTHEENQRLIAVLKQAVKRD